MKKMFTAVALALFVLISAPSSAQNCDSMQRKYDSLGQVVRAQNFRINRVKFYLNICMKNPKQDKFLKGWIRRAVSSK